MRFAPVAWLLCLSLVGCGNSRPNQVSSAPDAGTPPSNPDGGDQPGQDVSISVLGSDTMTGHIVGDALTMVDYPMEFVHALTVTNVLRLGKPLLTSDAVANSCNTPLSANDTNHPPTYGAAQMLVNPLASDVLLAAVHNTNEGKNVARVTNPLVLESATFSDGQAQPVAPFQSLASQFLGNEPGQQDVAPAAYSWTVLCDAAGGASPAFLTVKLKGKLGDKPYEGTLKYTSLVVTTRP
jgi:hypothetical protein